MTAIEYETITRRQQATWASGDVNVLEAVITRR